MTSFLSGSVLGAALLAGGVLISGAAQAQVYVAPPPVYSVYPAYAPPVYPAAVYPAPVYAAPVYPYPYSAPVMVRPAPVMYGAPVGISIGLGGGRGWRRGGWGVGVRF